jgi:hypothetical protein
MAGVVVANHHDATVTADHLAVLADGFDARTDFHDRLLHGTMAQVKTCGKN